MLSATDVADAPRARNETMTIPSMLAAQTRSRPDETALVFGGHELSYAELDTRTDQLARGLVNLGVVAGDRVGLVMRNRTEFIESFLACHKLGAVAVPINFRLTANEVSWILTNAGVIGVITDRESQDLPAPSPGFHITIDAATDAHLEYVDVLSNGAMATGLEVVAEADAAAFIMYTSGTTGRPKGAVLTHRSLWVQALMWSGVMGVGPDDVWLSGSPLFHIGAITGVLPLLLAGGTVVISPSTGFDAQSTIETILRHRVTMCGMTPTQWQMVCDGDGVAALSSSATLRLLVWGGSQAQRRTLETMQVTFPGAEIANVFGQTETCAMTCVLKGPDSLRKLGSVGRPVPGVELAVVDDAGVPVPNGSVGEIVYRGPTVMRGYYNQPQQTEDAFTGGWFHSGDLARADDEGFLYIVDRKKDVIISGGENIYPAELEQTIGRLSDVVDVAVIGVPHPKWVETPIAIVVVKSGSPLTEVDISEHCRRELAGFKQPSRYVVQHADLPRNAAGKLLKQPLREQFSELATPPQPIDA